MFGELYIPPFLRRQIEETRAELDRAKVTLHQLSTPLFDDEQVPAVYVPNNLPPQTMLVGREAEVNEIIDVVLGGARICVIEGISGVGKTSLAVEATHRIWTGGSYEAAIWIWLADMRPSPTLDDLCVMIARSLNLTNVLKMPASDQRAAIRHVLQAQRVLLVLDSFEDQADSDLTRYIENIPGPSSIIITSSMRLFLDGDVYTFSLGALSPERAIDLIRSEASRLGLMAVLNLPEAKLNALYQAASGNPYALKLSLGQMRQSGLSFESMLRQLTSARGQVFQHIYASVWDLLTQNSKQILLALSLFAGSATREALEAICKIDGLDIEESLAELVKICLVNTNGEIEEDKIRYLILALTRHYINSIAGQHHTEIDSSVARFIEYFVDFSIANRKRFDQLQSNIENVHAALLLCQVKERLPEYITLTQVLYPFHRDRGYWEECIRFTTQAIAYATATNDLKRQGALLNEIASIYIRKTRPDDLRQANSYLQQSEQIFTSILDESGLCGTKGRQARVAAKLGDISRAIELGKSALSIAEKLNDIARQADILHELGDTLRLANRVDEAESFYRRSKDLYESLGDTVRLVGRLNDLGQVMLIRRDYAQAREYLSSSIDLARRFGKSDTLIRALNGLALVEETEGHLIQAYKLAREANEMATRLMTAAESNEATSVIMRVTAALRQFRCIVFDFDNTLADSFPLHVNTWIKAGDHFHLNLERQTIELVLKKGLPSEQAAVLLNVPIHLIPKVVGLKRALFQDTSLTSLNLFEGVSETLKQLRTRGNTLAIASTNSEVIMREVLKRQGLEDLFIAIIGQESVSRNKPDPEMLFMLAEQTGMSLDQFVLVGDSDSDVQMARNAHISFVLFVPNGDLALKQIDGVRAIAYQFSDLLRILFDNSTTYTASGH